MLKRIIQVVLVAILAGYLYWPYRASSDFFGNFNSPNAVPFDKLVDLESVNAGEKKDLNEVADHLLKNFNRERTRDIDERLDRTINAHTSGLQDIIAWGMEKKAGGREVKIESRSWSSPREMKVRIAGDCGRCWKFRFVNLGGWKFVGWEIDADFKARVVEDITETTKAKLEAQERMYRQAEQAQRRQQRRR